MKVYTFSEARQNLADVLAEARDADVVIKRRNGECYVVRRQVSAGSPLDVPGITTKVTTGDILTAIDESRARS